MPALPNWIWSYSRASLLVLCAHVLLLAALLRPPPPVRTSPVQQVRVSTIRLQPKPKRRQVVRARKQSKKKVAKPKPAPTPEPVVAAIDPAPYRQELAQRLALFLCLPEFGAVRLSLTLTRNGQVKKVEVLGSPSAKNRDYVIHELKNASFPSFGRFFPKEKEHTFCLTLNNDF